MKIFVTILEDTSEAALAAIAGIDRDHDGVEIRAENLPDLSLLRLRAATARPLLYTLRGRTIDEATIRTVLAAGIDLVDVEWHPALDRELVARYADRVVLSHHDYDGVPDLDELLRAMRAFGCVHTKIAATPRNFAENQPLLCIAGAGVTSIGMGARGLYSRILAPFLGSELMFVAPSEAKSGAPGQITLERALTIYGSERDRIGARSPAVFAIAGRPASHSLSPSIHNALFREKGVAAAYTIAEIDAFDEIAEAFLRGHPRGLSITAPFKEDAFRFAESVSAEIGPNARDCGAVNTLINDRGRIVADNTDVDGFIAILREICGRDRKTVALVGAGGTARAALTALRREAIEVQVFNRTPGKLGARSLDELARFDGEVVIDTTSAGANVELPLRPGMTLIEAAYGPASRTAPEGVTHYDGLDLLRAQAIRQHELFMRTFDEAR